MFVAEKEQHDCPSTLDTQVRNCKTEENNQINSVQTRGQKRDQLESLQTQPLTTATNSQVEENTQDNPFSHLQIEEKIRESPPRNLDNPDEIRTILKEFHDSP